MIREKEIFRKIELLGANVLVLKVLALNSRLKRQHLLNCRISKTASTKQAILKIQSKKLQKISSINDRTSILYCCE